MIWDIILTWIMTSNFHQGYGLALNVLKVPMKRNLERLQLLYCNVFLSEKEYLSGVQLQQGFKSNWLHLTGPLKCGQAQVGLSSTQYKATEDCWLQTHLPHLLLDKEEDEGEMKGKLCRLSCGQHMQMNSTRPPSPSMLPAPGVLCSDTESADRIKTGNIFFFSVTGTLPLRVKM